MRRIISLLVVLSVCFGLIGCGNDRKEKVVITEEKSETLKESEVPETEDLPENVEEDSGIALEGDYSPLLYKITDDDGSCVWLFGSFHYATEEVIPMPGYVMEAYNTAEYLAVECDIIEAEDNSALMYQYINDMMYLDGDTIADHIPAELYDSAKALLEELDVYVEMYDYYIPYLWYEMLSLEFYESAGLSQDYGIDRNLLKMAKQSDKTVLEIESVDFQMDMLLGFSEEIQVLMLESAVDGYYDPETLDNFMKLYNGWYNGNEQSLIDSIVADVSKEDATEENLAIADEYNKIMLYDRNIGMADFAAEALESDKSVFICVGAGHVVGEDGMVDLLSEKGYQIEIIK